MSNEQVNIDAMSTEQLNAALASELNAIDGKANAEPESTPTATPESKPDEGKPADQKPADPPADSGKDADGEGDGDDEAKNPYRKRIDRLLRKNENLDKTVTEKEQLLSEKDKEIARLKAENEKLNKKGDDDDDEDDDDQTPEGDKDIKSEINEALDERERRKEALTKAQQEQDNEFTKLLEKVPNALKRKSEILEIAKDNPKLTFEAIDRILAPEDHIDPIELNRKDAQRLDPGSRSRADLETEEDITKATPDKQEKWLREQQAAGKLVI